MFIFWKRQIAHKWYRRRYDDFDWKRRPFAVLLPNLLLLYCFCLNFYFWNISVLTSEPSVDILSKLDLNINENIRFNARLIRTNVECRMWFLKTRNKLILLKKKFCGIMRRWRCDNGQTSKNQILGWSVVNMINLKSCD